MSDTSKPKQPRSPNPSLEAHANALGHVTIAFNELDDALAVAIGVFLRTDEIAGRIVTADMSTAKRADVLRALVPLRRDGDHDYLRRCHDLMERVTDVIVARNASLHSEYWPIVGDDGNAIGAAAINYRLVREGSLPPGTARGRLRELRNNVDPIQPQELLRRASAILDLAQDMRIFYTEYADEAESGLAT